MMLPSGINQNQTGRSNTWQMRSIVSNGIPFTSLATLVMASAVRFFPFGSISRIRSATYSWVQFRREISDRRFDAKIAKAPTG